MHIWLSNCWRKKREKPSFVLCNWTSNSVLPLVPLFTPPFTLHLLRGCYIQYSSERACDKSRQWYPDPTTLQPSEHHWRKHLSTWNRQGKNGADPNMEPSPWLNGHYCSEHLCTALFQLQGHAYSLGCSKLVHAWVVSPERVLKALWVLCTWDLERSLHLCAHVGGQSEPLLLQWHCLSPGIPQELYSDLSCLEQASFPSLMSLTIEADVASPPQMLIWK